MAFVPMMEAMKHAQGERSAGVGMGVLFGSVAWCAIACAVFMAGTTASVGAASVSVMSDDEARDGSDMLRPRYLLREGTLLRRMRGTIAEEPEGGASFTISDPADPLAGYRLVLTPGLLLEEVLETLRTSRRSQQNFEVTGRVLVFREHNYLLLTQPAILIETASESRGARAGESDDPEDDSAASIIRDLERSVGAVPRRVPGADPGDVDEVGRVMPEGARIVLRRGQLRRTPGGAFLFVFDADASGLADPPIILIPCMLLEAMERLAMERDDRASMLLTGTAFVFEGRNYLLPTVFRLPSDNSQLTP